MSRRAHPEQGTLFGADSAGGCGARVIKTRGTGKQQITSRVVGMGLDGDASELLRDWDGQERRWGIIRGSVGIMQVLADLVGQMPGCDLSIACWSTAGDEIATVGSWRKRGLVRGLRWVIGGGIRWMKPEVWEPLVELVGMENLRATEVHAKIYMAQSGERRVAITSSGNLVSNPNWEWVSVETDPAILDWTERFFAAELGVADESDSGRAGVRRRYLEQVRLGEIEPELRDARPASSGPQKWAAGWRW